MSLPTVCHPLSNLHAHYPTDTRFPTVSRPVPEQTYYSLPTLIHRRPTSTPTCPFQHTLKYLPRHRSRPYKYNDSHCLGFRSRLDLVPPLGFTLSDTDGCPSNTSPPYPFMSLFIVFCLTQIWWVTSMLVSTTLTSPSPLVSRGLYPNSSLPLFTSREVQLVVLTSLCRTYTKYLLPNGPLIHRDPLL